MAAYNGEEYTDLTISTTTAPDYIITDPKNFNAEKYDLYKDFQASIGWVDPEAIVYEGELYTDLTSGIETPEVAYGYAKYWAEVYYELISSIETPVYASNYIEYMTTDYAGMMAELATNFENLTYQDRMPLDRHGLKYVGQIFPYKTGRTRYHGYL